MMWDSLICLLYIKVWTVLCAFVCLMTVMCWLEKNKCFCGTSSFTLRNSKFIHYTQKCILCYWSVWYLLEQMWWHVRKYVRVPVTLIYTKPPLLLLSVLLSALRHHKRWLTCNVSFYFYCFLSWDVFSGVKSQVHILNQVTQNTSFCQFIHGYMFQP
jgi:hypothetical protein